LIGQLLTRIVNGGQAAGRIVIMLRNALVTAGLLGALATPALADTYTVDKQHTEAGFQVRHLLTKVRGTFRDVSGSIAWDKADPARSTVEFHLKTASVDTGVEQRDNHLRSQDFFWAEKYPEIAFVSTKVVAKSKDQFEVTGNLTIRGVTKQTRGATPRPASRPASRSPGRISASCGTRRLKPAASSWATRSRSR
jgi:polyisoprenoid-binding protein YceI